MVYLLIEEHSDWMDYITTTNTKIIIASEDKDVLEKYMNENFSDTHEHDYSITYHIEEVNKL